MKRLSIPRSGLEAIIDHARSSRPAEACGLLVGEPDGRVTEVHCLTNVEEGDPEVRYLIDAGEQFKVMREAETAGLAVIGAFHSHVMSPARPSETDISLAGYPEWAWLIVSLAGAELDWRAFTIVDRVVNEIEIVLDEES